MTNLTVAGDDPALRPQRERRVYALDLLRFVAASMVVAFHLPAVAANEYRVNPDQAFTHPLYQLSRYGWVGVPIFFVVSGFVICMSSWGRTLSQFFTSRVVRLFPAYLFVVLLTTVVLLAWLPGDVKPPVFLRVVANLTMLNQFLGVDSIDGVYWSLMIELKFYLLFALVVRVGVSYARVVGFAIMWLVLGVIAHNTTDGFLRIVVEPRYMPFFVAGITLYLIHRFGPTLLLWGMVGVCWVLCAVSLNDMVDEKIKLEHVNVTLTTTLILFSVLYLVMIAIALGWLSWLRWSGCTTIGALTYPLYLLHKEIGTAVLHRFRGDLRLKVLLALVLAGLLLLAYLTHRWIERPGVRLLRTGLQRSFTAIRSSAQAAQAAQTSASADAPTAGGFAIRALLPMARTSDHGVGSDTR